MIIGNEQVFGRSYFVWFTAKSLRRLVEKVGQFCSTLTFNKGRVGCMYVNEYFLKPSFLMTGKEINLRSGFSFTRLEG